MLVSYMTSQDVRAYLQDLHTELRHIDDMNQQNLRMGANKNTEYQCQGINMLVASFLIH
ncbi:Uncharacterised protein [Acinetobacter baumannii]|nr:Uncharacterised protein [Acinetobacter baumannii]